MFRIFITSIEAVLNWIKSFFVKKNKEVPTLSFPSEIVLENTQVIPDITSDSVKKEKKPRNKTEKPKITKKPVAKKRQKKETEKVSIPKQKRKQKPLEILPSPVTYITQHIVDLPEKIENGNIYVVGENGYNWLAVFKCPCGCNQVIQLNLLKDADPNWSIKYQSEGIISISPSVSRKVGCKSHFFITRGNVEWR